MSTKIAIDEVINILKAQKLEPSQLREIIEEINNVTQDEDEGEPKPPKQKTQYVGILSDPLGTIKADALVGWIVTIPEGDSPATTMDKIQAAIHDFNATKSGKLNPAKTVGEGFEAVKRKQWKAHNVTPKVKTPIYFLTTTNQLSEVPSV